MKRFFVICFIALLIIYAGCALCALFNKFSWDDFFKIIGIVGGLASIIGLGAAAFVRIDLLSYDAEAIEKLASKAKEIEQKENQIKVASDKIEALEYKKEELEILVKKASLLLYYRDELDRSYEQLLNLVHGNSEIKDLMFKIPEIENQIMTLEGEIEENAEIRDILSTLEKAKKRKRTEFVLRTIFGPISFKL